MPQSTQYHGLFSSSPLSSPPTSDDGRDSVETPANVTDSPLLVSSLNKSLCRPSESVEERRYLQHRTTEVPV